jgi:protein-S-isoprenylcysteine O-methyltransferase Ste14
MNATVRRLSCGYDHCGRDFVGIMRLVAVVRHLISIAALPGTVVCIVPIWIARRYGVQAHAPSSLADITSVVLGCVFALIGLALFVTSLRRFTVEGHGTLAPWDPPRRLVVHGPYRYVRNPMISGVIFLLAGEAAILRSLPHLIWMATFLIINLTYIPLLEEPLLARRFGAEYEEYRRHVRRFLPRMRPWNAS